MFTLTSRRCAGSFKYLFNGRSENPGREQNAQQIGVNRPVTSILNARFIVWRQTPARYNWPLIRVRQKVNSSFACLTSSSTFSLSLSIVSSLLLDSFFASFFFIRISHEISSLLFHLSLSLQSFLFYFLSLSFFKFSSSTNIGLNSLLTFKII